MTETLTYTRSEAERALAAREHVHAATCPQRFQHELPCPAAPTATGVLLALRILDERPRDAKGARRALHDVVCQSECGPESDHADRTQARTVVALRKYHTQESEQVR